MGYPARGSYVRPQFPGHEACVPGGGPGGGGIITLPVVVGALGYLGGGGGMFTIVAFNCVGLGGDMGGGGGTWKVGRDGSLCVF